MDVEKISSDVIKDAQKVLRKRGLTKASLHQLICNRFGNVCTMAELNALLHGDLNVSARTLIVMEAVLPELRHAIDRTIVEEDWDDQLSTLGMI